MHQVNDAVRRKFRIDKPDHELPDGMAVAEIGRQLAQCDSAASGSDGYLWSHDGVYDQRVVSILPRLMGQGFVELRIDASNDDDTSSDFHITGVGAKYQLTLSANLLLERAQRGDWDIPISSSPLDSDSAVRSPET